MSPFDYSLCDQTLTLYRKEGEQICRRVIPRGYCSMKTSLLTEPYGKSMAKQCLLIIPGDDWPLRPGDRVYAGVGPETVDWDRFLPVRIPELAEVSYAKPCRWDGRIVHWEAGTERRQL